MALRPVGSPIIPVKSPIRKMTSWPRSWNWRILLMQHRVAEMQVRRGRIEACLDPQRRAAPKLADEILLGEQILYSPFEFSELRVGGFHWFH